MLKYYKTIVTRTEFPGYNALCLIVSNCPMNCSDCNNPILKEDVGTELTMEEINKLIKEHPDITLFGIICGDCCPKELTSVAQYVKFRHKNLKVGLYSNQNFLESRLLQVIDCYKIGHVYGKSNRHDENICDLLTFPFTFQRYFELRNGDMVDCTYKFLK